MSKSIQLRRGNSVQHEQFAGAVGEITVDTDLRTIRVHDGLALGGMPLATSINAKFTGVSGQPSITAEEVRFRNKYDALVNFPTASTYGGMIGYATAEGKLYYSNGTTWVALTQPSDLTSFVNTGTNLGQAGDAQLFLDRVGSSLRFRTLRAGTNITLALDQGTNSYLVSSTPYTFTNTNDAAGAFGIYSSTSSQNGVTLKSLRAGAGVSIEETGTSREIVISSLLTEAFNRVTANGVDIDTTQTNDTLTFAATTGVSVTADAGTKTVTIGSTLTAQNRTDQTGSSVFSTLANGVFNFNKLAAGAGITLGTGANGEINIINQFNGTITGFQPMNPPTPTSLPITNDVVTGVLRFFNIAAGDGISVTNDGNSVVITSTAGSGGGGAGVGIINTGEPNRLAYYPSSGTVISPTPSAITISGNNIVANVTGTISSISNHSTTSLAEGTNLYYTQGRFDTAFTGKTTSDLSEGTNLYFTNERAQDATALMLTAGVPSEVSVNLTTTAATVSTAQLTFAATTGVQVGMTISGTGIPAGILVTGVGSTTVTVSPAAYVTGGATIVFANQNTSFSLTTTSGSTSTAIISLSDTSQIQTGYQVTADSGIIGTVLVTNKTVNSVTVSPGYNITLPSGAAVKFTNVPTTGLRTSYNDDSGNSYTYSIDPLYIQNQARNAISVISGQGLGYDPVSGRLSLAATVTQVNGYTGSVTLRVADIPGAAPTASPVFTGTPQVPTPTGTVNLQATNVQFVNSLASTIIGNAPLNLSSIAAVAAAINNDSTYYLTINNRFDTKLNVVGGAMTGTLLLNGHPDSLSDPKRAATKLYVDQLATVQSVNTKSGNVVLVTDDIAERSTPSPINLWFTNTRARQAVTLAADNSITEFMTYVTNTGQFKYNATTSYVTEGTNLYFTTERVRQSIDSQADNAITSLIDYDQNTGLIKYRASTDYVNEGVTNLYFSNTRARSAITLASSTSALSLLSYNTSAGQFTVNPSTDVLTEGTTNIFYTNARARAAMSALVTTTSGGVTVFEYNSASGRYTLNANSDSFTEGSTNQFFTSARARGAISLTSTDTGILSYNTSTGAFTFNKQNSDQTPEGISNLYFTTGRAREAFEVVGSIAHAVPVMTPVGVGSYTVTAGGSGYSGTPTVIVGGSVKSVTITSGGTYAFAPGVTFSAPATSGGVTATGYATLDENGAVNGIVITHGGTGYTGTPTVTFASGSAAGTAVMRPGSGATATATVAGNVVTGVSVTVAGTGYTEPPLVSFTGGGGTGATATSKLVATSVASYAINHPGSEYQNTPTVVVEGGGGLGATATATVTTGAVTHISITNGGSGYVSAPDVTVGDTAGGAGATATALVNNGKVTAIVVNTKGSGYTKATASITFNGGGGSGAQAVPDITNIITAVTVSTAGSGYTSLPTVKIVGGGLAQTNLLTYNTNSGFVNFGAVSDSIQEGVTNLFYTPERARSVSSVTITNTHGAGAPSLLSYSPTTGVFTINNSTDSIALGSVNRWYTDTLARGAFGLAVTTNDGGSAGSLLNYTQATGQFTLNNSTDSLREGTNNIYFTQTRARDSFSIDTLDTAAHPLKYDAATGKHKIVLTVDGNFTWSGDGSTNLSLAQNITTSSIPKFIGTRDNNNNATGGDSTASTFVGGALTIDLAKASVFYVTITSNISSGITVNNPPPAGSSRHFTLIIKNSTGGANPTMSLSNAWHVNGGRTGNVLTCLNTELVTISFVSYDGTNYYETARATSLNA